MGTVYVTLPPDMVAIRYPGYFYHITDRVLYSLKGGTLKPVKWIQPNKFSYFNEPYVRISHKGTRRTLCKTYLDRIGNYKKHTVIPVKTLKN